MIAEVVSVGSELLAGQIANTNARYISEALAGVGVPVTLQTAVGDDVGQIERVLRAALGRADVVVVCGGLGPTHDDLTREAVAAATGRLLKRDAGLVAGLERRFARMGRTMSPSNRQQADVPAGAVSIDNPVGTAPGIFLEDEGRLVYVLPGVPDEMEAMMRGFVLPDLSVRTGGSAIVTRTLRTAGIPESDLADRLAGVIGPNVGVYASQGEVRVCLTAPASDAGGLPGLEREVRTRLGSLVYGEGDTTLERVVSGFLRQRGLRLAVAESLTGGMLASRIVGVPGASDIFVAGYVAYSAQAKIRDLGVPPDVIERHGLVSTETAVAMALGARARAEADVALSTTGEAGPSPAEAAVGQVCVGLSWEGGDAAWTFGMGGGREMIRRRTCTYALNRLRLWLLGDPGLG
ncbi:MAG: nicotinamide-nucleotide amidase [Actinomycetota bacterium]|nr:nicotinamide-nucleotide amidase [Actinomycetota bacterium]